MAFKNNSKAVKEAMKKANKLAMVKSCEVVLSQAKELVNIDTGNLKGDLHYKIDENPDGSMDGIVGASLDYAQAQEFDKKRGSPYLRPAFRLNRKNIENFFGQELKGVGDK